MLVLANSSYKISWKTSLGVRKTSCYIFLLTGLRIYTGEYKDQGPMLCPTEGRALQGPRALDSPVYLIRKPGSKKFIA